jgi:hypothetical protein
MFHFTQNIWLMTMLHQTGDSVGLWSTGFRTESTNEPVKYFEQYSSYIGTKCHFVD